MGRTCSQSCAALASGPQDILRTLDESFPDAVKAGGISAAVKVAQPGKPGLLVPLACQLQGSPVKRVLVLRLRRVRWLMITRTCLSQRQKQSQNPCLPIGRARPTCLLERDPCWFAGSHEHGTCGVACGSTPELLRGMIKTLHTQSAN